jgi:protein gp37
MAETTNISWADATFNPWIGCTCLSPACDHCYAKTWAARFPATRGLWDGTERKLTAEANWKKPIQWNRDAIAAGEPKRVFCASLADVFDNQVPVEWRERLWKLIYDTPALIWTLLTKRPQNVGKMLPGWIERADQLPRNVMLGFTAENQDELNRRGWIAATAANACGWPLFCSAEPLLGPLDFRNVEIPGDQPGRFDMLTGIVAELAVHDGPNGPLVFGLNDRPAIAGILTGGESGTHARPHHPNWHRRILHDCLTAGVPFHFKQWGEWIDVDQFDGPIKRKPSAWITPAGDVVDKAQPGSVLMVRAGTRESGRTLDGETHDARPTFAREALPA